VGPFIIVLILGAVAVLVWLAYRQRQKRREELFLFATQHGLEYSRVDPFGLPQSYGFRLFSEGDGRGCENVISGAWQGLPVKEGDYWYYDESTDSEGHTSKSYSYFSVVVADLACAVPDVLIQKETLMSRIADHLGFHDIDFESEEFNRAFQVKSKDREFAYKLIDARMIHWLLSTEGSFGFEVVGPNLLAYCKRRRPSELIPLFGTSKLFVDHVPDLVWKEYGFTPQQPNAAGDTD
jgi:hypothetical protein